jgi:hypothetical protein
MILRALALCLMPGSAMACAVAEDFFPEDLARAPVVVRAEVLDYHQTADNVGHLSVAVVQTLKGKPPRALDLEWSPTMAEWPPAIWDRPIRVILAAQPPQDGGAWQLAFEMCGSVWVVPDNATNRATIAGAISGQR